MKTTRTLLSIVLLCSSTVLMCDKGDDFGMHAVRRSNPFDSSSTLTLKITNKTKDNAVVTAFYSTGQTNVGTVSPNIPNNTGSFTISNKNLQEVVITAGSTIKTVTYPNGTTGTKEITIEKN